MQRKAVVLVASLLIATAIGAAILFPDEIQDAAGRLTGAVASTSTIRGFTLSVERAGVATVVPARSISGCEQVMEMVETTTTGSDSFKTTAQGYKRANPCVVTFDLPLPAAITKWYTDFVNGRDWRANVHVVLLNSDGTYGKSWVYRDSFITEIAMPALRQGTSTPQTATVTFLPNSIEVAGGVVGTAPKAYTWTGPNIAVAEEGLQGSVVSTSAFKVTIPSQEVTTASDWAWRQYAPGAITYPTLEIVLDDAAGPTWGQWVTDFSNGLNVRKSLTITLIDSAGAHYGVMNAEASIPLEYGPSIDLGSSSTLRHEMKVKVGLLRFA